MSSLTLDQIRVFLAVVDEGSFTKAATRLNRARSAVTYGVQNLEAQIGLPLFDRLAYRPTLTEAGRTLLWRARRIAEESTAFQRSAQSLASGLEAELTIVLDSMFPVSTIVEALRAFTTTFPTIQPRLHVQPLGAASAAVLDGTCAIGLLPLIFTDMAAVQSFPLLTIDLVSVVSSDHPLAAIEGTIATHLLQQHVQLVLSDRSALTAGRDYGVLSARTWRLADLGAKQSMLLAGLGWGNMPRHMVADDVERGRLKIIRPADFDPRVVRLVMGCAHLKGDRLGPGARWFVERLTADPIQPA